MQWVRAHKAVTLVCYTLDTPKRYLKYWLSRYCCRILTWQQITSILRGMYSFKIYSSELHWIGKLFSLVFFQNKERCLHIWSCLLVISISLVIVFSRYKFQCDDYSRSYSMFLKLLITYEVLSYYLLSINHCPNLLHC